MNATETLQDMPLWLACLTALLIVTGAGLTLTGTIGLLRLKHFYDRIHAPSLGATLGTGSIVIASILYFSVLEGRLILFPVLIAVFITVTTPVIMILLARAALYRDNMKGKKDVPHE